MTAKPLCSPMPGLIAMKCRDGGADTMIAVLGIGVVESDGTPDRDEHIATGYADLATDTDPAGFVVEYWAEQASQHDWLGEQVQPLIKHLHKPSPDQVEAIRKAAGFLATVTISGAEDLAKADLLGRCYSEMLAIINKRHSPGYTLTLEQGMLDAAFEGFFPKEGDRVADLWCASGMRMIGAATWMRAQDKDPQSVTWIMMDGDPRFRAIAAINAVAFELGEKVEILDGTDYKRALIAATMRGESLTIRGRRVLSERLAGRFSDWLEGATDSTGV